MGAKAGKGASREEIRERDGVALCALAAVASAVFAA